MEQKIIVFLDNIQRTIIATLVTETDSQLIVTKPAVLSVVPSNDKKIQIQLYPVLFRELLKSRDVFPNWSYPKGSVAVSVDIELEVNLVAQYNELFKVAPKPAAPPVVQLFDADGGKK